MEEQESNLIVPENEEEKTVLIDETNQITEGNVEKTDFEQELETLNQLNENLEEEVVVELVEQVSISVDCVAAMFGELSKKFDDKIAADTHKNQLFDKMYKELQSLKDDPYKKTLKPIFMDLIVFADSMKSLVSRYEETPEPEVILEKYQKLRKEFNKIGSHIEDLLYNYSIEPFSANEGDEFDPKTQQAKKTTAVENDADSKKIIGSLLPGYYWDEQLLRKESVHIGLKENNNN
ncbi:MAG: nucleotide exchange factor GrpE [Dysgonamonadaceae bacterium]|jgi:molecular chaperone GrpE (heat shock protein)|nr:nucleotide exchange factor GrpE [Dysgonamonadaceae bacterium]